MTSPADPLIGRVLERRYQIDAPIARGGMSSVYVGTDVRLHRRVAVKVMDSRYVGDPQFLRRFEFEARAVAGLSHPGLVAVYDQSIDGDIAFLVMELVRGGSVRELLRERGPMPPHAVAAIGIPMLGGLGTAHRAGLVHRDVKPENVLISDTGDIKVADFGLVRAVAEAGVTSASVILGTAAYLSPEQVSSTDIDARSDVYSAGVLMFELLTGRQPFSGATQLALAYQRLSYDVPAPSDLIPGVPPAIDDIVLRATERRPEDRYVDGFAMQHAILDAVDELGLPPFTVPAPSQASARVTNAIARPVVPRPIAPPAQATPDYRAAYAPDDHDEYNAYDEYDPGYDHPDPAFDLDPYDDEDARSVLDDHRHARGRADDGRNARGRADDGHNARGRADDGRDTRGLADDGENLLPPTRRAATLVWFLLVIVIGAGLAGLGWMVGATIA